ncbi:hypothetical protein [Enterobacter ludwigii]|uniref:hypothetical protein n=1 Tax=Enterobacter ludwigii TaxID=299767 RepID=UPI0028554DDA|nr:hypothetical protein [Enterobacter ludwigii]ELP5696041.1 hypothetical protein [Enterobacter ludwigii]WNI46293.1 hypothetical protein RIK66_05675 [Enterobacter ludwigii]WNI53011.1 hypothetical protein RIL74_17075 [Enterobacter ludwigii]WNI83705.1 hypothetical protein RIK68_23940 [Enterobacter ludwigii]HDW0020907.1 hypothetical protein [Enterobacter ludwigii]
MESLFYPRNVETALSGMSANLIHIPQCLYWHKAEAHSHLNINDISPGKAMPFPCQQPNRLPGRQRWWKTPRALNRYDYEARYSLIVSLHVPETDVDLLTPVQS